MPRVRLFAVALGTALALGACTASGDDATVIEVVDVDKTTTSSTEVVRLEYTEFPELTPAEAALCRRINATNRSLDRLDEQGTLVDRGLEAELRSITLSDPLRVKAVRDNLMTVNSLQSEGYAAIAAGAELALSPDQAAALSSAQGLVDRLVGFNEQLADLDDPDRIRAVNERQAVVMPPLVVDLDETIRSFNSWAWSHCKQGGIGMTWDDFLPVDPGE